MSAQQANANHATPRGKLVADPLQDRAVSAVAANDPAAACELLRQIPREDRGTVIPTLLGVGWLPFRRLDPLYLSAVYKALGEDGPNWFASAATQALVDERRDVAAALLGALITNTPSSIFNVPADERRAFILRNTRATSRLLPDLVEHLYEFQDALAATANGSDGNSGASRPTEPDAIDAPNALIAPLGGHAEALAALAKLMERARATPTLSLAMAADYLLACHQRTSASASLVAPPSIYFRQMGPTGPVANDILEACRAFDPDKLTRALSCLQYRLPANPSNPDDSMATFLGDAMPLLFPEAPGGGKAMAPTCAALLINAGATLYPALLSPRFPNDLETGGLILRTLRDWRHDRPKDFARQIREVERLGVRYVATTPVEPLWNLLMEEVEARAKAHHKSAFSTIAASQLANALVNEVSLASSSEPRAGVYFTRLERVMRAGASLLIHSNQDSHKLYRATGADSARLVALLNHSTNRDAEQGLSDLAHYFAGEGNVSALEAVIATGRVSPQRESGILTEAISRQHVEVVRRLLALGFPVHHPDGRPLDVNRIHSLTYDPEKRKEIMMLIDARRAQLDLQAKHDQFAKIGDTALASANGGAFDKASVASARLIDRRRL